MPSTFSPSLRIELIGAGEQAGTWNVTTNNNLGALLEQAITGATSVDVTAGNVTLTSLNGVVDEARSSVLSVTGTPGVTRVITIPNVNKNYTVQNSTANIVQIKTASGTAFDCPPLSHSYISCNASNVVVGRSITTGANAITSLAAPFASPAFTGVPTAPTAAIGTNTTQLATTAFVQSSIPVGLITMWSGSIASIPAGWALCDGTSGRPDLRDRFIVGAGTTYAVGAIGGANTVTLDTTQIPSHTHTGSGTSGSTDLAHTHTGSGTTANNNVGHTHTGSGTSTVNSVDHTHTGTTGNNNVDHSHTGSGTTASTNLAHTHSGTTASADVSHTHAVSGNTGLQSANHVHSYSGTTSGIGDHAHGYTTIIAGGSDAGGTVFGQILGDATTAGAGAHSHTFSGNTAGVSADHSHAISFTSGGMSANSTHTHTFTTGAMSANADHTHTYSFTTSGQSVTHVHAFTTAGQSVNHTHDYSFTTSGQSADHNHTYSFTTSAASVSMAHTHTFSFTSAATGGGLAHENRPPYFALAYIIKT